MCFRNTIDFIVTINNQLDHFKKNYVKFVNKKMLRIHLIKLKLKYLAKE
jgi:hypothetical protein